MAIHSRAHLRHSLLRCIFTAVLLISACTLSTMCAAQSSANQGLGLLGAYYNGINFNSFGFDRIDPQVDFPWGGGSPGPSVGGSSWSATWTGQVLAPVDGVYTFSTFSDDGVQLWVNGQQLIDDWTYHGGTWDYGSITLQAGQFYTITLQYFQGGGGSDTYLEWSYPGQDQQVIPQSQLYGNPYCMLDNTYLSDAWSVGSTVANIQGAAGETGVTLSYALVPGDGSDNNADFTINGTTLRSPCPSITPCRTLIIFASASPTATGCIASSPLP